MNTCLDGRQKPAPTRTKIWACSYYYGKVILIFIFNHDDPVMLTIKPITLP